MSRLKVLSEKPSLRNLPLGSVRFVACSATVPNLHDVGRWLQVRHPPAIDLIDTIAVFLSHPFPFPCLFYAVMTSLPSLPNVYEIPPNNDDTNDAK